MVLIISVYHIFVGVQIVDKLNFWIILELLNVGRILNESVPFTFLAFLTNTSNTQNL